jgi:hypothetical protein
MSGWPTYTTFSLNVHCPVCRPNAVTCHPMYTHADTYFSMFYRNNSGEREGESCRCLQQWALLSFWNAVCSLSNQPGCLGIPMANNTIRCNPVLVPKGPFGGKRCQLGLFPIIWQFRLDFHNTNIYDYQSNAPNVKCLSPYFPHSPLSPLPPSWSFHSSSTYLSVIIYSVSL